MAGSRRRANLSKKPAGTRKFGLRSRWRRALGVGGACFAIGIAAFGGLVAYAALTLPDINQIGALTGTIKLFDRHGTLFAQVGNNGESRQNVDIKQISSFMQDATIGAEDRNFRHEGAFDVPRVVKALVDDVVLRRPAEGASTITQQLAKEAFFGAAAEKSPLRKVKEALLANEIDSRFTKDQILDKYLNITYYGANAYGIESAAQRYFGKDAANLNLMESSLLAGLPEAPSYNDPYNNPDAAYERMHYVLGGMVATGAISQSQADSVDPLTGTAAQRQSKQQVLQNDLKNGRRSSGVGVAPHFVQYIQDQLQQIFADSPGLINGDLNVTTTLDLSDQTLADRSVEKGISRLSTYYKANNGALLMLDANTGQILAMVGSANFSDDSIAGQYNVVTGKRRPGSSFKPYVYEEGFRSGAFRPDTILQDTAAESQKLGGVQDFDRSFMGPITAARALVLSRNVAAEQAMEMAGIGNVIDFAHSLGITTDLAPNASTAIGTSAVRMIDHAAAYAAFANGGHRVTAYGILKITDNQGNVIRDYTQPAGEGDVMTPADAWTMTNILRGYARQWGMGFRYDTAGKSGTTDNFVDAWYMVYSRDWVVATWAGRTSGSNPGEQPMNGLYGTIEGKSIAVPFVNQLPRPHPFIPVSGALNDCDPSDMAKYGYNAGCPTPTPTPTPSPSPSASPTGTPSGSPSPSGTPVVPLPSLTPTPTPTPTRRLYTAPPPTSSPTPGTSQSSSPAPGPT